MLLSMDPQDCLSPIFVVMLEGAPLWWHSIRSREVITGSWLCDEAITWHRHKDFPSFGLLGPEWPAGVGNGNGLCLSVSSARGYFVLRQ